jgi:NADPH:quinone reductase-like Zn-dependent oxidoreductase
MKAITYHRYGSFEELKLEQVALPRPKRGEVLVQVTASALNPIDCEIRSGHMQLVTGWRFPRIAGSDFAGTVVDRGPGVDQYANGDPVYGFLAPERGGALAEYLTIDTQEIARMPLNLKFEEAAGLPLAAQTVVQAFGLQHDLKGKLVFIHGASGGVGVMAVQIAKILGAEVHASCSFRNTEMVKKLGADQVVDYTQNDIRKLGAVYDVFFDVYGNMPLPKVAHQIVKNGRHLSTIPNPINFFRVFNPLKSRAAKVVVVRSRQHDLELIAQWVETGRLLPIIDRILPMAEAAAAHEYLETKRAKGKVIIRIRTLHNS